MLRRLLLIVSLILLIGFNGLTQNIFYKSFDLPNGCYPQGLEVCLDGGYLVFGDYLPSNGFIFKLDSTGQPLWTRVIEGPSIQSIFDILEVANGYFFCGQTNSMGAGGEDLMVGKIDFSGNLIWTRSYGASSSEYARYFVLYDDSTIGISGYTGLGAGANDFYHLRIDQLGNQLNLGIWGNSANDFPEHIAKKGADRVLVNGYRRNYAGIPHRGFISEISNQSTLIWEKQYGLPNDIFSFSSLFLSNDRKLLTAGVYGGTDFFMSTNNIFFAVFDSIGNLDWIKGFDGGGMDYVRCVRQNAAGEIFAVGETASFGGGQRMFIIKLDSSGNLIFQKEFGNNTVTSYRDGLRLMPNGEILVLGNNFGNPFLARLDSMGNLPFCALDTFAFNPDSIVLSVFPLNFLKDTASWGAPMSPPNSTVSIIDTTYCCPTPIASFNVLGCLNDTISFLPLSSNTGPGTIYIWDYNGDGVKDDTTMGIGHFFFSSGGSYLSQLVVKNSCGTVDSVTIAVNLNNSLTGAILMDTIACSGAITLALPSGYGSYLWSTGDTDTAIVANSSGIYSVTVTNSNGCVWVDSAIVWISPLQYLSLGTDSSLCSGDSLLLYSNVIGTHYWNTGFYGDSIWVNTSGVFSVEVTDSLGCTNTDSVQISIIPYPVIYLGPDTTVCQGQPVTLNAAISGGQYFWNTGDSTPQITILDSGQYEVVVTIFPGCTDTGAIKIGHFPITILEIGNDSILCEGDSVLVEVNGSQGNILWMDGSMDSLRSLYLSGLYSAVLSDSNGCTAYDSINLEFVPIPVVELGNDTTLCEGEFITLETLVSGATYQWSTGANTSQIVASSPGIYSVEVLVSPRCISRDTFEFHWVPNPRVDLGKDTLVCGSGGLVLSMTQNFQSVLWDDGSNSPLRDIQASGNYSVYVVDSNGCTGRDSLQVEIIPLQTLDLGPDTTICDLEELRIYSGLTNVIHNWSTGDTTDNITLNHSGIIVLNATNQCQTLQDSISVLLGELTFGPFFPNAFSPNGDYINDKFEVVYSKTEGFHLMIFDRWGKLVFESFSPFEQWTGNFGNESLPEGVYSFRLNFQNCMGEEDILVGTVTLLR